MKRVCVYCGSNAGRRSDYAEAAKDLARALVNRHIDLVYGGASVGVMGVLANTVLAEGGHVIDIIPKALSTGKWPTQDCRTCVWWRPCMSAKR